MAAKTLDRFILREIISDGSAGTVYRADEVLPGENTRPVALKVLQRIDDPEGPTAARFFGEVKVLAQLAVHPHIVTIYGMGLTDNYPWLAMESAPATLESQMNDDVGDVELVLKLLRQVGLGLSAMHALQPPLIHQDLKPGNILIDPLGNYKVTDFSLATVIAAKRTHGMATVRYAAPEMLSSEFGKISPATDLYALGHIAYELALGGRLHVRQYPAVFEGNTSKEPPPNKWMMWHASMNTKAPPVHEIRKEFPVGLSAIIAKLMAKPMAERYASADAMLQDLRAEETSLRHPVPAPAAAAAPGKGAAVPPAAAAAPTPSAASAELELVPVASTPAAPSAAAPAAGAAPAPPATTRYWVRLRGRVTGPYDLPTLQRQSKQGALSRLHQLSADQVHWKAASEVEGLFGPTVV